MVRGKGGRDASRQPLLEARTPSAAAMRAGSTSRGSRPALFDAHPYLPWRWHRAGLRLPLAGLAGGQPAPLLPLHRVTPAAFIAEAEEKHVPGAVEKQAAGSRCLRASCSEPSVAAASEAEAA